MSAADESGLTGVLVGNAAEYATLRAEIRAQGTVNQAAVEALDRVFVLLVKGLDDKILAQKAAVDTALIAAKEATAAAFAASETAIVKSEQAQRDYNEKSNEFRASLDDSNKDKIGRAEFAATIHALEDKLESRFSTLTKAGDDTKRESGAALAVLREEIAKLREGAAGGAGEDLAAAGARGQRNFSTQMMIVILFSTLGTLTGLVGLLLALLKP